MDTIKVQWICPHCNHFHDWDWLASDYTDGPIKMHCDQCDETTEGTLDEGVFAPNVNKEEVRKQMNNPVNETIAIVTNDVDDDASVYDAITTIQQVNNTQIELRYSKKLGNWTNLVRGKIAVKLHDHGNGARLTFRGDPFNPVELDYSEIIELYTILTQYFAMSDQGIELQFLQVSDGEVDDD